MAADRWGARTTKDEKRLTPEQFEKAWQLEARKIFGGEPIKTPDGAYFARCGRSLGGGKLCLQRLGHSVACAPHFGNICDKPMLRGQRCVLTVGHRCGCMPVLPRSSK